MEAQLLKERADTQQGTEERWLLSARGFQSRCMTDLIWLGVADPNATGTSLEGSDTGWLKQVVLAGAVAAQGWMEGVDRDWKWAAGDEGTYTWLLKEGRRVRKRIMGKGWLEKLLAIPVDPQLPDLVTTGKRLRSKGAAGAQGLMVFPRAAPARPPAACVATNATVPSQVWRRLRGKQAAPTMQPEVSVAPVTNREGKVRCECGNWVMPISMAQHKRLYCPLRIQQEMPKTREARKILRQVPPTVETSSAASTGAPVPSSLPRPDVHVRWAAPLVQPKRNASSIPGDRGEAVAKNTRGKPQGPSAPHTVLWVVF